MELIRFKKNGGPVTIHMKIEGLVAWRYKYVAEDKKFVKHSQMPEPYSHMLGLPHDLENDINSWDIQIGNPSDEDQNYTATIVWEQDDNKIHEWSRSKTIKPDAAVVEEDDCLLVGVD